MSFRPSGRAMGATNDKLLAAWSRRRFIASTLPLALVPALSWAGPEAAHKRRNSHGRATDEADKGQSRPAAGETAQRLTTSVNVDGAGPFRFMVDTGAERTVISEELATLLKLPRSEPVMLQDIVRAQETQEVQIERLATGLVTCTDLRVPMLPHAMLQADGYLGIDVLNGHRVIFDFKSGTLKIEKAQGFFSTLWAHEDQIRIRAQGTAGKLRSTDCYVDGVRATAFIDSGAEASVCNPPLYAALQHRKSPPTSLATVELSGVTGGTITGAVTLIDTIKLPGLTFTVTPVVIADLPVFALWGLRGKPALLIGMNCLRAFSSVSIDYGRKDLLFQVPSVRSGYPSLARTDSQLG